MVGGHPYHPGPSAEGHLFFKLPSPSAGERARVRVRITTAVEEGQGEGLTTSYLSF